MVALPALFLVLPMVIVLTGLLLSKSEYPLGGGPENVPCADVLEFGGAELPAGAEPVGDCTEAGWQDLYYSAVFRMPRADVEDWLSTSYPDAPAPETEYCPDDDAAFCLDVDYTNGLSSVVGADGVKVSVVYVDAETALVRYSASTY
ncbi:hypothetical protein [Streptomyces sp. NPDC006997]|uniref:hypothetical protein n=1 Tax=Streptomyces sp. NPDC006997 TaxID=3155356 RepID=UPI00340035EA